MTTNVSWKDYQMNILTKSKNKYQFSWEFCLLLTEKTELKFVTVAIRSRDSMGPINYARGYFRSKTYKNLKSYIGEKAGDNSFEEAWNF